MAALEQALPALLAKLARLGVGAGSALGRQLGAVARTLADLLERLLGLATDADRAEGTAAGPGRHDHGREHGPRAGLRRRLDEAMAAALLMLSPLDGRRMSGSATRQRGARRETIMGDYLISPPEQTDLHIDPAHLADTLRMHWSDAEVRSPSPQDTSRFLEWELRMNGRVLLGALARAGDAVYLDGDVRDCAVFAQWFRIQIPSRYNVVFYDEAYTADIELHDTTSAQSIAEPFLQQ